VRDLIRELVKTREEGVQQSDDLFDIVGLDERTIEDQEPILREASSLLISDHRNDHRPLDTPTTDPSPGILVVSVIPSRPLRDDSTHRIDDPKTNCSEPE
jgi:hypothetical protein